MQPVFSFTGGIMAGSGKTIFYALHQDANKKMENEFGYTDVWSSDDSANNWKQIENPFITNVAASIKPSYSAIACAEYDAANAYIITNRYEEKKIRVMFIGTALLKQMTRATTGNGFGKVAAPRVDME